MSNKSIFSQSSSQPARKLWDSILKSIIHHMPEQLFPLLKHAFDLSSIFADVVMRIAGTDLYHLECQTKKDEYLSFRMFEYDTHIALLYGISKEDCHDTVPDVDADRNSPYTLRFPASVILHLDTNSTVPEKSICRILLSDTSQILYTVTTVKVQNYSLQQIWENHLTIFLPFTLLRFHSRLNSKMDPVTKKELTIFVNKIIIILKDELLKNDITERQYKDYINYIRMSADQIFMHHPELHKEVTEMLIPIIPSYSDMEDQITERVTAKVTREVTAKVTDEVTAKVTDELTVKMADEFQKKLKDETALLNLKLQKKDSQLSAVNSENRKLRALLRTHGIAISELT